MIYKLTPESRGEYASPIDYAKYLLEKIKGNQLVVFSNAFNPTEVVLEASTTNFSTKHFKDLANCEEYLKTIDISKIVLVIETDKEISNTFVDLLNQIPFALLLSKTEIKQFCEANKISTEFYFEDDTFQYALAGRYAIYKETPKKKVLAVISTFNEEDIITQVVEHLIEQDVDVQILENWSTDKTLDIVEQIQKRYPNRIFIEKFPIDGPDEKFQWKKILNKKVNNPISKQYDWIIHCDADEIRISPWLNQNLNQSISFIDSLGFNAISFTVVNFRPVGKEFTSQEKLAEHFDCFEFGTEAGEYLQVKAWKNTNQDVDLSFHFGHDVVFEDKKIFPLHFLLKHYALRSDYHGKKKIHQERLTRYIPDMKASGAHSHYDSIIEKENLHWNPDDLIEYKSDSEFYNKYFIQATSASQIKIEGKAAIILGFARVKNEVLLIEAIKRLYEQSYRKFDIFIYDNSEVEDSLAETRKLFPDVIIKKNVKNNGFAGGNNSVMREALKSGMYDYVVLLNDDTQVHSKWLSSLIECANKDKKIGAVTSKLIFYEPFVRIEGSTQTFSPKENNLGEDSRNLGVKFYLGECRFENTHYVKKFLREGFYGMEGYYTWTDKNFTVDLPIGSIDLQTDYELIIVVESPEYVKDQTLTINISGFTKKINLIEGKETYKIIIPNKIILENKFDLIQNASSGITAQFNGYDIGSLNGNAEIDKGQYDIEKEAELICGGAVLFKADTLRNVGLFDEYYFVYYEDSDLSMRIRHAGYKLMYQPKAVVRHIHAGSSTEYSPLFTYHVWKNKPVFVIKNFGIRPSIFALKELTIIEVKELQNALRHKLRSEYHNSRLKVILKSSITFYTNLPAVLLKKFNIIKSA